MYHVWLIVIMLTVGIVYVRSLSEENGEGDRGHRVIRGGKITLSNGVVSTQGMLLHESRGTLFCRDCVKVPSFDRFLKKFLASFHSILNVVDSEATDIKVWCG